MEKSCRPKSITFGTLCNKCCDYIGENYKPQSKESSIWRTNTLRRLIGDDTLADRLNAPLIAEQLKCESAITYNERLTRIKAALRWAYRANLIEDISYLEKLQKRKTSPVRVKDAEKYLENKEIEKLLSGMKIKKWKLLTEFLILSGLRIEEAIALTDADVDLSNRTISVTKTFSLPIRKISSTKQTHLHERFTFKMNCCRVVGKSKH